MIENALLDAFMVYALTFVLAASSLFEPLRKWVKVRTPRLQIGNNKHFVECRMCLSFWCAVLVCANDREMILPVYGLAYFLATQER